MERQATQIKLFQIIGLVGLIALTPTVNEAAGTTGASFLQMGAGARSAAMGDAFSAVSDDVTATYWNPAGLGQITAPEIGFMQNSGLVDTNYQFFGAAMPYKKSAIGFSLYNLDHGSIDRYSALDQRDGSFDAGSFSGNLTLSSRASERLRFGLTAKFMKESIETESASSFGADLGLMYLINDYKIGLVFQHIGPGLKFVQETTDLPQTLRAGVSRHWLEDQLLTSFDLSQAKDEDLTVHAGTEFHLNKVASLRAGYKTTPSNNIDVDGMTNITAGLGLHLGQFQLDYAFVPYGDLGDSHRFSLLYSFNTSPKYK